MLKVVARLAPIALLALMSLVAACPPPGAGNDPGDSKGDGKGDKKSKGDDDKDDKGNKEDDTDDHDQPEKFKPPPPRPIEVERVIRALEAENADLKRRIAEGKASSKFPGMINAHEHLYKMKDLERYLPAARAAGVSATVVVASPIFTLEGNGPKGEPGMSKNFEEVIIEASKQFPGEIIPFCTIDPTSSQKLETLKKHVAMGCKGLKIYSGHSNFAADHGPLDKPDMDAVYAYLEETQLPMNWHINLAKFMPQFEAVLSKHPKLNVMIPHYGVSFWKPKEPTLAKLKEIMRTHKNVFVDTSLGTREILLDGMAAMEPAREDFQQFFLEFQDQIVWGTDSVITGNIEKTPTWYTKVIWATRDHLEKDVLTTDLAAAYSKYFRKGRDADGRYQGLALPEDVLKKVYVDNAKRWLRLK
jgi:predicted TIM-barrel fold metal-dependent hydrolase